MRDKRFVARHRGGPLSKNTHKKLIRWARLCSEHIMPLLKGKPDPRLSIALQTAKDWEQEKASTGAAMKASLAAHAAAREAADPIAKAIARSVGQGVATAHMADHSMGAALYALRAINLAGRSVEKEKAWQIKQLLKLAPELSELVLSVMAKKEKSFKLS